ncbi:alpha/beta fold hydrolase [Janibacter anophelis]|uniref:alpha/beta fold hydrolase n=1 Tax=Janibacter anophelis TaxID=319054 RepID=UPI00082C29CF|nr:alpha/beta hydrolase [Janibacter anophelis]
MGLLNGPPVRTVFVHGRGRSGPAAWPRLAELDRPGHVFLARTGAADQPERDADRAIEALGGRGHLVGHSYGAVTAMLAAQRRPDMIRSLVLLEPACYDVARGGRGVEGHIRGMAPVFAVADDPQVDGEEFLARFAAGMGAQMPDLDAGACETIAARIRATPAPWEVDLRTDTPRLVPTLVITGDETPMYAEVAAALEAQGATHLSLPGTGHRPQDSDEGMAAICRWQEEHSA